MSIIGRTNSISNIFLCIMVGYVLNENYCYVVLIYYFNYLLLLTIPLYSFITIVMKCMFIYD